MSFAGVRAVLTLLSLLALAIAGVGIARPIAVAAAPPDPPSAHPPIAAAASNVDALVDAATTPASFRATRVLATVRYDPTRSTQDAMPGTVTAPPKPVLSLSGLVWGVEPAAVMEGWPGVVGPRVVRAGDVIGELKVKRIGPSGVVITGFDTTWTLQMRMPWQ
jgi:Na+-transporting methylmalonyl-CoA/oxaloacetate decarboxylase gamma subunit